MGTLRPESGERCFFFILAKLTVSFTLAPQETAELIKNAGEYISPLGCLLELVKQSGRGISRSDSHVLSMCFPQEADFLGQGVGRGEESGPRRGLGGPAAAADEQRHLR